MHTCIHYLEQRASNADDQSEQTVLKSPSLCTDDTSTLYRIQGAVVATKNAVAILIILKQNDLILNLPPENRL